MHCNNKRCRKIIRNKYNIVKGNNKVFCSHNCFIEYDLRLMKYELEAAFIRTRISVLRQMMYSLYYLRRPYKLAEFKKRIKDYRQNLELVYNKLAEV